MNKKAIVSDKAPAAVGPYSQAVEKDGFIFVSGQIALKDGSPITDWGEAVKTVFDNVEKILAAAGAGLRDVLKTTVYVTDMTKFGVVNEEYARRFAPPYPARVCVGVSSLPKGSLLEIECVAKK